MRAPTLVTIGRWDLQMPPACAEELARGIPGARLVRFEPSGHYPFVEELDALWASVGSLIAEPTEPVAEPAASSTRLWLPLHPERKVSS